MTNYINFLLFEIKCSKFFYCSQSKISILMILFLKFALSLQEGYSTLFWNPTSTVVIFSHDPYEHISVKFYSSNEIGEIISPSF